MKQAVLAMVGLAFVAGISLTLVDALTTEQIASNVRQYSERQQRQIWNTDVITFNLQDDQTWIVATRDEPIGRMYRTTTSNGYNGDITLWVGVRTSGEVQGVRVIQHQETPGLGDQIDHRISPWIDHFTGHSLDRQSIESWDVISHGGVFDQFTGATITPRAVVHAVRDVLIAHNQPGPHPRADTRTDRTNPVPNRTGEAK
ncbi:MAG: RnfABCDGE type electron transport complex subunit G [Pseudomonadota bacterium]